MIPTFLFTLAAGMLLVLATGNFSDIAWKFLRLCGFLTLAMVSVATAAVAVGAMAETGKTVVAAGVLAGVGSTVLALGAPLASRISRFMRAVCAAGGVAALVAAVGTLAPTGGSAAWKVIIGVGNLTGAALLGGITIAWLLGHAYLTATRMTIVPLRHFSRVLSWAVVLRVAFVILSILAAWPGGLAPELVGQLSGYWLVVALRIGLGLFAVGVFAYMVADCVRLRSTQSATGILYFGSLFAYVGELAAQHLTRELAWPM